jgi:hypothetical protein
MAERVHKHPAHGDLYTPMTPEIIEMLNQLYREYGSWRRVAYFTDTRLKVLRNLRQGRRKAISMRVLDRILTGTNREGTLDQYLWFTADDLVTLGIWKPVQYVEGRDRIQGGVRRKNEHKNRHT